MSGRREMVAPERKSTKNPKVSAMNQKKTGNCINKQPFYGKIGVNQNKLGNLGVDRLPNK